MVEKRRDWYSEGFHHANPRRISIGLGKVVVWIRTDLDVIQQRLSPQGIRTAAACVLHAQAHLYARSEESSQIPSRLNAYKAPTELRRQPHNIL